MFPSIKSFWRISETLLVLLLLTFSWEGLYAELSVKPQADLATRATDSPLTREPVPEIVSPPKRPGTNLQYSVSARRDAFHTLGLGLTPVDKLFCAQPQGFQAENEQIRQFRLSDSRHVLALYERDRCYSLILIYKAPPQKGKGRQMTPEETSLIARLRDLRRFTMETMETKTKDSSLEAWLMRHKGFTSADHYLPLESWTRFFHSSAADRGKNKDAFRLEGNAHVLEDAFGLVKEVRVELRSAKPLPPFLEYLDFHEKQMRTHFEWRIQRPSAQIDELKQEYQEAKMFLADWSKTKASEPVRITGSINGGWSPPPWFLEGIYFP
jgi:hypothetical protein